MTNLKYKFLEKIATADLAFEAYGLSLDELFSNCGVALCAAMVDPKTMSAKVKKVLKIQSKDLNSLLIDFLNEIVYFKGAESLLFPKVRVKVKKKNSMYLLAAELAGEKIDFKKHKVLADVKAATWHMFELKRKGKGWYARVVLDI